MGAGVYSRRMAAALREEALITGKQYYSTGHTCRYGHIAIRITATGACLKCREITMEKYKTLHPMPKKPRRSKIYTKEQLRLRKNNARNLKYNNNENYRNKMKEKIKNRLLTMSTEIKIKSNEQKRKYVKTRKERDYLFKLQGILRKRVNTFFRTAKKKKKKKTYSLIGASLEKVFKYLEDQFKPGMTWQNHGRYGWHIDHITPLASAKTEKELLELFHYTNLQPLWAVENFKKGSKDMQYKVSTKIDGKWKSFGNIRTNKFGNEQLGIHCTPEFKNFIASIEDGKWINFSLFEDEKKGAGND